MGNSDISRRSFTHGAGLLMTGGLISMPAYQAGAASAAPGGAGPVVRTRYGRLEGIEEAGLSIFRGIPFAAPPVGKRRWLPPAPPARWNGVRPAKAFGAACPHQGVPGADSIWAVQEPQSEDCLYLNVWTPGVDDARRPVMVWIHGGGFDFGAGSQAPFDGRRLARHGDVVVVTINYRLGPFGFLNLSEITGGAIPSTGNEGLLDMVAALEWVRDNIAAFGGDPGNVTIFGESAGGRAVGTLLALPSARGLFHKGIAQSGIGHTAFGIDYGAELGRMFLAELGLSPKDVDKIRAADTQAVLAASPSLAKAGRNPDPTKRDRYVGPVIDGKVLPGSIIDLVAAGSARDVALMVGTTRNELAMARLPDDPTLDEIPGLIKQYVPREVDIAKMAVAYREARRSRAARTSARDVGTSIAADAAGRMPGLRLLDAHRRIQPATFHYIFSWNSPIGDGSWGSPHGGEIGFVFGTHADGEGSANFFGEGPAADALSKAMMDAWTAFARTGDPSTESLGVWPAYGDARSTMMIGERMQVVDAPYEGERRAWEPYSDKIVFSPPWFKA